MASIILKDVTKLYSGDVLAVDKFCLDIADREFVVFVGPSGCGKSTTLRMIAGLEEITSGEIYIGDTLINNVQPKNRNIAMVFQSYALYPHMTVYKNMAFAMKMHKVKKKQIEERVTETAKMLGITHLLKRKPRALSGGESQRVALGRAMVRNPEVFLLDEPLSNLDAKLRTDMRAEVVKLHKKLETTFIYVTHDQTEAMTMGDRIVLMNGGHIMQVDSPKDIYNYPASTFVAGFIGSPRMNFVDSVIAEENGIYYATLGDKGQYRLALNKTDADINLLRELLGKPVTLGIRPEHVSITDKEEPGTGLSGAVADVVESLGAETNIYADLPGGVRLVIREFNDVPVCRGQAMNLAVIPERIHLFFSDTGVAITGRGHLGPITPQESAGQAELPPDGTADGDRNEAQQ